MKKSKYLVWLQQSSLWLAGLGLMLASSGLDGVYMARWMPEGMAWLGWVLNTTSDVASVVLTYWFGRLQQGGKVKRRMSLVLLPAELVTVSYGWFFSWRQLKSVMGPIEGTDAIWVAPVAAGFIPVLLAAIGYAQSLLAGKLDTPKVNRTEPKVNREISEKNQAVTDFNREDFFPCPVCDRFFGSQNGLNSHVGKIHAVAVVDAPSNGQHGTVGSDEHSSE